MFPTRPLGKTQKCEEKREVRSKNVTYLLNPRPLQLHQSHYSPDPSHINTKQHTHCPDAFPPNHYMVINSITQLLTKHALTYKCRIERKWLAVLLRLAWHHNIAVFSSSLLLSLLPLYSTRILTRRCV